MTTRTDTEPSGTARPVGAAVAAKTVDGADTTHEARGPWNPGIDSALPPAFLPLSTMHRPETVATTLDEARQFRDLSGLPLHKLTEFRPERLAIHELLIRVMADLSVPDGDRYTDLGENFRAMTTTILERYIAPHLPALAQRHTKLKSDARAVIMSAIMTELCEPIEVTSKPPPTFWQRLTGIKPAAPSQTEYPKRSQALSANPPTRTLRGVDAIAAVDRWRTMAADATSPLDTACYRALTTAATAILNRTGRIGPETAPLAALATVFVANSYGSERVGAFIDTYFRAGATAERFHFLPTQSAPIVMNVKGASAAGKSTLRPKQRLLAERLGVTWSDFALISPDVWRKYLLDYASLGEARRYAGTLTGHELEIIDKKLDAYMAGKAEAGRMTHLLIDRFRFDSFVSGAEAEDGRRLLTRFGASIYMFFMITPPAATVERAFIRGEKVGRYKAVDDLLAHNVEAYTGIPGLFFTWALRTDKHVHFEFLDNSVPNGEVPRTVAFGINNHLIVLDIAGMLNIDRFRLLNVNAHNEHEIFSGPTGEPAAKSNEATEFLRTCVRRIPLIEFADALTGDIYLRIESGRCIFWDANGANAANPNAAARQVISDIVTAATVSHKPPDNVRRPRAISPIDADTLGQWGDALTLSAHPH